MRRDAFPRIPVSTYRLQLHRNFTFADAIEICDYLKLLGISDVYTSPILQAKKDSSHCYDVIDHGHLNSEIGGMAGLDALSSKLRRDNMGLLVDIVPNHMSTDLHNSLWYDVLEYGVRSEYSSFFDIYWFDKAENSESRITLPILGDQYRKVLTSEQLNLIFDDTKLRPKLELYSSQRLPLSTRSYNFFLNEVEKNVKKQGIRRKELDNLHKIMASFEALSEDNHANKVSKSQFHSKAESTIRQLGSLYESSASLRSAVQQTVKDFNQTKNPNKRYRKVRELLALQNYKICYWRSPEGIPNYRRFFYINDLVAIRAEDPAVFSESHQLLFDLITDGKITGLRVDHIDGLRDPAEYLRRLQRKFLKALQSNKKAPEIPLYVTVEKILAENERLPSRWSAFGTTGYDFSRDVGSLYIDSVHKDAIINSYKRFTGCAKDFKQVAYESKKKIIERYMRQEINRLSSRLWGISRRTKAYRAITLESIRIALEEVVANFPVYRTYLSPRSKAISFQDSSYLQQAFNDTLSSCKTVSHHTIELLQKIMTLQILDSENRSEITEFIMRFQQITAPIVAKGIEDTAFYRYNPIISLNEVGGDPDQFGISTEQFHSRNITRLRDFPQSMLNTSTHDSKRSEDARSRISVLSEIPEEWFSVVKKWSMLNKSKLRLEGGRMIPDKNDEYLFYQALIGCWPFGKLDHKEHATIVERMVSYMKKASKEAKLNTSWIDPDRSYDEGLESYVRSVLDRETNSQFLASFLGFFKKISYFGMLNSLSQQVLKLTSPGVPDIYQGNELWDFSLVDPDNRRPVDFRARKEKLNWLVTMIRKRGMFELSSKLLANWQDGALKMSVIHAILSYRREHFELFATGKYFPLRVNGQCNSNVVSFMRSYKGKRCVVIVPLLFTRLTEQGSPPVGTEVWGDTCVEIPVPGGTEFRNLFTNELVQTRKAGGTSSLSLSEVYAKFPFAVLT